MDKSYIDRHAALVHWEPGANRNVFLEEHPILNHSLGISCCPPGLLLISAPRHGKGGRPLAPCPPLVLNSCNGPSDVRQLC
jgi:hypothetical protein